MPFAAFFDLDGTLAIRNGPPFPVDVAAMRAFQADGNYLFLCTGRSTGYLYPAILDIGFDGIIAGGGAYATIGDRFVHHVCVDKSLLPPLQQAFEHSASTLIMETERYMIQLASPQATHIVPNYPRILTAAEWQATYTDESVSKFTVYGPIPDTIRPFVDANWTVIEHGRYEEVVPIGCSKADAIRRVLQDLGLSREQSIGFGDSMNDYDMLQYVGVGVAMGNATDAIKAIADRITAPFDEGGVAMVLQDYLHT